MTSAGDWVTERKARKEAALRRLHKSGLLDPAKPPSGAAVTELTQIIAREEARDLHSALTEAELSDGADRILTMAEFRLLTSPEWLIRDVIPGYGVGHLIGPSGSFKSFHAIHLALSVANHLATWFGSHVERGGAVLYVAMEGGFDFARRVDAWLKSNPGATDSNLHVMIEQHLDLGSSASVSKLRKEICARVPAPRLIVVDTQGLATPGREEDTAVVMNQVFGNCKALAKALDCFVLLVHHTGHDEKRERGSSAQRQAVDVSMIIRDGSALHFTKVKAGAPKPDVYFEMEPSGTSLVVKELTGVAAIVAASTTKAVALRSRIVDFVRLHPRTTKSKVAIGIGGTKATVLDEIDELIAEGVLRNEGTPSNTKLVADP